MTDLICWTTILKVGTVHSSNFSQKSKNIHSPSRTAYLYYAGRSWKRHAKAWQMECYKNFDFRPNTFTSSYDKCLWPEIDGLQKGSIYLRKQRLRWSKLCSEFKCAIYWFFIQVLSEPYLWNFSLTICSILSVTNNMRAPE